MDVRARFWRDDERGVAQFAGTADLSEELLAHLIVALGLSDRDCEPGTWCGGPWTVSLVPVRAREHD